MMVSDSICEESNMNQTITAVFDGKVLRPDSSLLLRPNNRYIITIQEFPLTGNEGDAWDTLDALSGSIEAPIDWASEPDHYLYGTPKRQDEAI
jgi:hypothetical protein